MDALGGQGCKLKAKKSAAFNFLCEVEGRSSVEIWGSK